MSHKRLTSPSISGLGEWGLTSGRWREEEPETVAGREGAQRGQGDRRSRQRLGSFSSFVALPEPPLP